MVEEILMELEDSKRDSARLTWLIEEALEGRHHLVRAGVDQHSVRAYVDHHMAPANADAERARWCQGMKAEVAWSTTSQRWIVAWYDWYEDAYMQRHVSDPDRDTAIDKARGVK
jgi:hypothetical protein